MHAFLQQADGQRLGRAAIGVAAAAEIHRRTDRRDGGAGMNCVRHDTRFKNMRCEAVEVRGDDDQRLVEIGEGLGTEVTLQVLADLVAANESFGRGQDEVHQRLQGGAVLDFAGAIFELRSIQPRSPERADVGAHAAACDGGDGDAVFFENLDDTGVRQTTSATAGEDEPDPGQFFSAGAVLSAFFGTVPSPCRWLEEGVHGLRWLLSC